MKTINLNVRTFLLLALSVIAVTSCTKESTVDANTMGVYESLISKTTTVASTTEELTDCINSFALEPLSASEISALTIMREEELLAMDIYTSLYKIYPMPVFNNISKSEFQHTTAVKTLLDKYGLPDIAADHVTGVFVNTDIQNLYNSLLAKGKVSLIDALTVGATIEDLDIRDLKDHMEKDVDNADILFVFTNLQRGSRNHMRAFYRLLQVRGITYSPQYISMDHLTLIVNGPHESGSSCRN